MFYKGDCSIRLVTILQPNTNKINFEMAFF